MFIFPALFIFVLIFYCCTDPMKALALTFGWILWLIPSTCLLIAGCVAAIYGPLHGNYFHLFLGIIGAYAGWRGVKGWVCYLNA